MLLLPLLALLALRAPASRDVAATHLILELGVDGEASSLEPKTKLCNDGAPPTPEEQHSFLNAAHRHDLEAVKAAVLDCPGQTLVNVQPQKGSPKNGRRNSALHQFAEAWKFGGKPEVVKEAIEFLIEQRADINAKTGDGKTALNLANGNITVTQILWEAQEHAFLDLAFKFDRAAVEAAIEQNPWLVNAQPPRKGKPGKRSSALHQFAQAGDVEAIKFLLAKGADVNAQTDGGKTAYAIAKENNRPEAMALLLPDSSPLEEEPGKVEKPVIVVKVKPVKVKPVVEKPVKVEPVQEEPVKEEKPVVAITGPTRCGKGRVTKQLVAELEKSKGWKLATVDIESEKVVRAKITSEGIVPDASPAAGAMPKVVVIEQDQYWSQFKQIVITKYDPEKGDVTGSKALWSAGQIASYKENSTYKSQDSPECIDFVPLLRHIKTALEDETVKAVILDGFQILHSAEITKLCTHTFLLDVDKENTIKRRADPNTNGHNPNYLPVAVMKYVVWPEHQTYLKTANANLKALGRTWTAKLNANYGGELFFPDDKVKENVDKIWAKVKAFN